MATVTPSGPADQGPLAAARRRWPVTLLKVGLSLLVLAIVAGTVDLSSVLVQIARQDLPLVFVAAAIFVAQVCMGSVRWLFILRALDARPRPWDTFKLFYLSVFLNAYLWGGIGGDIARAWLSYRSNISARASITSVVLDRLAGIAGMVALTLLTAPLLLQAAGGALLGLAAVALIGLAALVALLQLKRLPDRWQRVRAIELLRDLEDSLVRVFLSRYLMPILALTVVIQFALAAATFALARSLDMDVSLFQCFVLMQPVALASNLPISVGGWGVRETAMISAFALIGSPVDATLALSIELGIMALVVALPGGIVLLTARWSGPPPAGEGRGG